MAMGNGATQTYTWNDRVQPTGLTVTGAATGNPQLLGLSFYPCASSATWCTTGNNGNLRSQTIAIPGLSLTQSYSYDHLNRLTGAAETGGADWTQNYGYDMTGNRWVATNSGLPSLTNSTPQAQGWFDVCSGGSGAACTGGAWLASAKNQVLPSQGWNYDLAGNTLQAGSSALMFTYDAENRQVTANLNGAVSNYSY